MHESQRGGRCRSSGTLILLAGNVSSPGATVTSRALALLGAFDEDHRRLTLTELAAPAGLPLPTAHRLVGELVAWGALARDVVRRLRRRPAAVGPRAARARAGRAGRVASPYLHDLYGATLATVHLAVRDGTEVLYLDRLRGHLGADRQHRRLPAADARHRRRQGAARARARRRAAGQVLADLPRITPYTITQPGRLRRQLAQVLRDDYATTVEEMSLGACSVAVPIRRRRRRGRRARHRRARRSSGTEPGWSPRSRWPPAASAARSARSSQRKRRVARPRAGAR